MNMKLLDNRAGIITGGASGIGRAAAVLFASEGAKILVADFNQAGGEETVELVRKAGAKPASATATCATRRRSRPW